MRPIPDRPRTLLSVLAALFVLASVVPAAAAYHDDEALATTLKLLARQHERVRLSTLATTPEGRAVSLLAISPATRNAGQGAAILVVANPLGTCPLATEAALELARELAAPPADHVPDRADSLTWYIVPRLDPDGTARFFADVRRRDGRNGQPRDDDADGAPDEDPADDLDGDGTLRVMLLPDPEGAWIRDPDDPRLYREARPERGERGRYRKLVEGDDDDGDGVFNEDGPGGVVPGRNFPHDFDHWTTDAGPWAAYCPETRALLAFAYAHPEIAMVLELGASNTLRKVPEPDKPVASGGKYRLPRWLAREAGLDPRKEYTLQELVDLGREYTGDRELTAEDVLAFLGLGIPRAPHRRDMDWWKEMSERYGEFLEEAGLDGARVDPAPVRGGSVVEWGYYQLGVPSLALDFWSVPVTTDSTAGDGDGGADDDALTPDRIEQMMREQEVREEAGGVDPDLKALATFATTHPAGPGGRPVWADWREVTLRDGRTALVGGPDPFALRNPPDGMVDSLLTRQVPWLREMAEWLPRLGELAVERRDRGAGVEEVTVVLPNPGRLPYPTAMGARTGRVPPVVVTIEGATVLHGRPRQVVEEIPAGGAATVTWLLHGRRGDRVTVTATAPPLGTRRLTFTLGDAKGGRR